MDYQLGPGPLQVDQNTIDEKIKGDIGIVENGDVATHAIPSGYYVIWKGDLYIAKTDISSGTTLSAASNGNLTAKPNGLGAEVAALNSKFSPALMSTDANDAIASGTYYLTGDCANRPADWCIMTVIAFNGETLSQTATSVITGKTYVRSKSVNGWTSWEELALNSNLETIIVNASDSVASKCTRNGPVEIKPGATGAPRSGFGYIGYCSYGGSSFRHVIVSEYSTGNLYISFGSSLGSTWYQIPYNSLT